MKTRNFRNGGFTAGILLAIIVCSHAQAQALQFKERQVNFRNGAVELSGTMLMPEVQGQTPAIVFLHGSGPHERAGFRPYAEEFAKLGVASLFFDKRGSGASGGSWTTSSLNDLAGDALAAARFLKTENGIDPERIGFWGISQAGWIAPLAASQSNDIAFMILISGGGATPKESEYFSYRKMFEHVGLSEEEKTRAFEIIDLYFEYLATGEGRSRLVSQLEKLKANPGNPLHQLPEVIRLPSEENRKNWSWVASYDPAPNIEKFKGPILLLFGDMDTEQPTELAVKRWQEGLNKANNDEATIMVFPGAGHGIRMGQRHDHNAPFADGYEEVQLGWLWKHVVTNSQ